MGRHTLWCDCRMETSVQIFGAKWDYCAIHKTGWPCKVRQEYVAEILRRHLAKTKEPVRLVHGAHAATGGSALDQIGD